jgi:pyruvate kinase
MVSDYRPEARLVAYTPSEVVHRRLAALWGIESRRAPEPFRTTDFMVKHVTEDLLARGLVGKGEAIAVVSATPPDRPGFGASMMQVVLI